MEEKNNTRLFLSIVLLIIIHIAGIIGLFTSYRHLFLMATPFNLMLSALLLLINHKEFNRQFWLFIFISMTIGYLIEVTGVKTGIIFGSYHYGNSLGFKILDVPLIIAVNWFILTYCAGVICNKIKSNIFIKSLSGSLMLVTMDVLIEHIAAEYDFWYWQNGTIPLQNYMAWFLVSFLILLTFYKLNFAKVNKLAPVLFVIQMIFFALLGLL
jgi:bisanhydrobacterioruberin hydratase